MSTLRTLAQKYFALLALIITISFTGNAQETTSYEVNQLWSKSYDNFGLSALEKGVIDNDKLIISGTNWPTKPSGKSDQLVTMLDLEGNVIWQEVSNQVGITLLLVLLIN